MRMGDRYGVELDYCPKCRGIWLASGQLDRIVERSTQPFPEARREPLHEGRSYGRHHDGHYDEDEHDRHHGRKRGFLSDLFD